MALTAGACGDSAVMGLGGKGSDESARAMQTQFDAAGNAGPGGEGADFPFHALPPEQEPR